ncbi:MAG: hypothetical protein B7Y39_03665 [Bdellovibrio sp. 28-41-41]|nr:MAG: hypothetical protein B7Y39_03665 [Bdellovibrio sp. 28-41-41]
MAHYKFGGKLRFQADAFLFDLDGTLINSIAVVNRVWSQWAIDNGLDPVEVVANCHGRRSLDTIKLFAPHLPQPQANDEFIDREVADTEGLKVLPGAIDFLKSLPPDRWAIVTSCTTKLAKVRMEFLKIPQPTVIVVGEDVSSGKPDPQGFLMAAKKLGFAPENCVVFEDAPAGIEAGQRAGMKVVTVTAVNSHTDKGDAFIRDFQSVELVSTSPLVIDTF